MKPRSINNDNHHYFAGGLAELVASPTPLTFSFFRNWFTGENSLGKAMEILGLPYQRSTASILECIHNHLVINLAIEEQTLYRKTIFKYKNQPTIYSTPKLTVDLKKIVIPSRVISTIRMVLAQSQWISNPTSLVKLAQNQVSAIPSAKLTTESIATLDNELGDKIWPNVIAIGLLSEFYNQLLITEYKNDIVTLHQYISQRIAKNDWFFRSLRDQVDVKMKKITFTNYITLYGLRADNDYELTCPRWYEIPQIIKKRIENCDERKNQQDVPITPPNKVKPLIETSITLELLRSEAKRKTLVAIDNLRKKIMQKTKGLGDMSQITREELLSNTVTLKITKPITIALKLRKTTVTRVSGSGTAASAGIAKGVAKYVTTNEAIIPPGTIGIFPNASPEFAILYPKCTGMIFLRGGLTSHGAIVAREFGIPAIIDSDAHVINDGSPITIDGTSGKWQLDMTIRDRKIFDDPGITDSRGNF